MEDERIEEGLSLIKQLAACNKGIRDKALGVILGSWLPSQPSLSENLMKKLWKGLFYCVWHADKLDAQTHLIHQLSSLIPTLEPQLSLHYLSVFLITMRREWTGIDVLRLDKFYLLIRRFLHNVFVLLKNNSWDLELSRRLMGVLEERTFLADDKLQGNGVNYHIASVFLEELRPFLPVRLEVLDVLLVPFVSIMGKYPDKVLLGKVKSNMFDELLKNGKKLLEVKKLGEEVDSGGDVEVFGLIALKMGFSAKFYDLGSSPECFQGNRKVLFGLHEEFLKLEKDLASSGIEVSFPNVVDHDEDEVPNLIPIAAEEMEVVASEPSEGNGIGVSTRMLVRKCKKIKKSSDESNEKVKKSKKKKKNESSDSDKEKSSTNKDNKDVVLANGENSNKQQIDDDGKLIPMNESVISNLQQQFEKIAAEAGLEGEVPTSFDLQKVTVTSTVPKNKKKRKRGKSTDRQQQSGEGDPEGGTTAMTGEKSAKKVRFSMKSNLVWKPQSPLPPQSLRLPPSVTPRGSALKKGVPPGPIREIPTQSKKMKLRATVKKARKTIKRPKTLKSRST